MKGHMQTHFEINVAKNGKHFFSTSDHSLVTADHTRAVYKEIVVRFPKRDGYTVTISYIKVEGEDQTRSFNNLVSQL